MFRRAMVTILFIFAYVFAGIALEVVTTIPALFAFYGFCSAVIYMTLSKLKYAL